MGQKLLAPDAVLLKQVRKILEHPFLGYEIRAVEILFLEDRPFAVFLYLAQIGVQFRAAELERQKFHL